MQFCTVTFIQKEPPRKMSNTYCYQESMGGAIDVWLFHAYSVTLRHFNEWGEKYLISHLGSVKMNSLWVHIISAKWKNCFGLDWIRVFLQLKMFALVLPIFGLVVNGQCAQNSMCTSAKLPQEIHISHENICYAVRFTVSNRNQEPYNIRLDYSEPNNITVLTFPNHLTPGIRMNWVLEKYSQLKRILFPSFISEIHFSTFRSRWLWSAGTQYYLQIGNLWHGHFVYLKLNLHLDRVPS